MGYVETLKNKMAEMEKRIKKTSDEKEYYKSKFEDLHHSAINLQEIENESRIGLFTQQIKMLEDKLEKKSKKASI